MRTVMERWRYEYDNSGTLLRAFRSRLGLRDRRRGVVYGDWNAR
jgi:hypothetical protein